MDATVSEGPKQENIQRRDMRMMKGLEAPYKEQLRASLARRRLRSDFIRVCSFLSRGQLLSLTRDRHEGTAGAVPG